MAVAIVPRTLLADLTSAIVSASFHVFYVAGESRVTGMRMQSSTQSYGILPATAIKQSLSSCITIRLVLVNTLSVVINLTTYFIVTKYRSCKQKPTYEAIRNWLS